jgi:hypothetical protein
MLVSSPFRDHKDEALEEVPFVLSWRARRINERVGLRRSVETMTTFDSRGI